eukprot:1287368-Pyramimonas_sp.AAC.1
MRVRVHHEPCDRLSPADSVGSASAVDLTMDRMIDVVYSDDSTECIQVAWSGPSCDCILAKRSTGSALPLSARCYFSHDVRWRSAGE